MSYQIPTLKQYLTAESATLFEQGADKAYTISNGGLTKISTLLNAILETNFLGSTLTPASDPNSPVIEYLISLDQEWKTKEEYTKNPRAQKARYAKKEIRWNESHVQDIQLNKVDLLMNVPDMLVQKASDEISKWKRKVDKQNWLKVEEHIKNYATKKQNGQPDSIVTEIDLTKKTDEEVYSEIVNMALRLMEHEDSTLGIDGIEQSKIGIFVKPSIYQKIVRYSTQGNFVKESIQGNPKDPRTWLLSDFQMIAGIKVKPSTLLKEFEAVAWTSDSAGSGSRLISLKTDEVPKFSDRFVAMEIQNFFGIVCDSNFEAIKKPTTAPSPKPGS
ncbi:Uncharacterised protein (plasmid) [Mesomycoplasma conjunctivae]|uniref:HtpE n=1 Tax=Mycoplasmopsis fermentans (strain M64) TaxID=943945 RepID=A0AB32XD34_MYCFM|nr:hypothetical protein [Mycoplasmopsis fermentans]AAT65047.1 htpE [Mycoplasma phage phiMFV1]VEU67394.1 Uncharacterised protein [Mesomycoplasma conjunctivae]ADV34584.1 HtpE [Mycoplasmopsis fermentans M64]ADV34927.1 HtpE [Mycoplasmopsis fermentans M64]VEU64029.1 Uncharacterised protein [Mycoplasmopsis fermentans]